MFAKSFASPFPKFLGPYAYCCLSLQICEQLIDTNISYTKVVHIKIPTDPP